MNQTKTLFEVADEILKEIQAMGETDWIDINALWVSIFRSNKELYLSMSTETFLLTVGILIERGFLEYRRTDGEGVKYFFMIRLKD